MSFRKLVALAPLLLSAAAPAPKHYAVVHGWPLLPLGRVLGAASGVAVNSRGEVLVFHRGRPGNDVKILQPIAEPVLEVFDGKTGRLLREFGAGMFVNPHGISVGSNDHVWITDTALDQVFEFDTDFKLVRTLGERGVAGADDRHFDRPTDVAPLADGSFYVSDGYGNSRVMKFAADGHVLLQWGSKGTGPGQFNIPHTLAVGPAGRVYVADRANGRVQIFDSAGAYLSQWKSEALGRPYGVALLPGNRIAVADGGENPPTGTDHNGIAIVSLTTGRIIQRFAQYGNYDGQLWLAHDIAADKAGNIYVVDILGRRVQKFALR